MRYIYRIQFPCVKNPAHIHWAVIEFDPFFPDHCPSDYEKRRWHVIQTDLDIIGPFSLYEPCIQTLHNGYWESDDHQTEIYFSEIVADWLSDPRFKLPKKNIVRFVEQIITSHNFDGWDSFHAGSRETMSEKLESFARKFLQDYPKSRLRFETLARTNHRAYIESFLPVMYDINPKLAAQVSYARIRTSSMAPLPFSSDSIIMEWLAHNTYSQSLFIKYCKQLDWQALTHPDYLKAEPLRHRQVIEVLEGLIDPRRRRQSFEPPTAAIQQSAKDILAHITRIAKSQGLSQSGVINYLRNTNITPNETIEQIIIDVY